MSMYDIDDWRQAFEDGEDVPNDVVKWLKKLSDIFGTTIVFDLRSDVRTNSKVPSGYVTGINFGYIRSPRGGDSYKTVAERMVPLFRVNITPSNCGLLQLCHLATLPKQKAKKFAEIFTDIFHHSAGYSVVEYTTAHDSKAEIGSDNLCAVLEAVGFEKAGEPWKNQRSGSWIQHWYWVM